MNTTNILIVGQGISGTMLSWYLYQEKIPFIVIDSPKENSASKIAAGIINPVTGRRIVKTWWIDEIMPFAFDAYTRFGQQFNSTVISQKNIIDFFSTTQMKSAFEERINENADYLSLPKTESDFLENFKYINGYGIIAPSYVVDLKNAIHIWNDFLKKNNLLVEDYFDESLLIEKENEIEYKNIIASKIIFADGENCSNNKWFKNLPWSPNKGEALIIESNSLDPHFIYKMGLTIAPLQNSQYWVGANYLWNYEDANPTQKFFEETKLHLDNWLKKEYTIIKHVAAIRPANIERRPFVGFHPKNKNIGILNGMGAKGTSLTPFFANAFVQNISNNTIIPAEADVQRFTKVLSR